MFSPRDKATACGMWSTDYIIALIAVCVLIVTGLILSRKMSHKGVKIVIVCMAIFASVTEVMKMIFVGVTYGIKEVEFVPMYFCSLFIYATILACTNVKILKTTGLSFLFFGGIIGAVAFFAYPSSCIPNYPIYHFMCLRTMLYHGSMIYTGILIVMRGYYVPNIKHFWNYFVALLIICLAAYTTNMITGSDFMYISKPLAFNISQVVFEAVPSLYPFIIMILEIMIPFFASFLIYGAVKRIKQKINNKA